MTLRPYQVTGSKFLQNNEYSLLCDDAGSGKSAMVLDAMHALGLRRVLCVGPAVAGVSWPRQVAEWGHGEKYTDIEIAGNFGFGAPGFYFVSFDLLSRVDRVSLCDALNSVHWDALVIDEGQYLKTPGSNRTAAVYGDQLDGGKNTGNALAFGPDRVWVLSGTLTPNHAGEAYTHLRALFPGTLAKIPAFKGLVPELWEFENRFCRMQHTQWGRVATGSQNTRELRTAMAPVLMRRLKRDIIPDLPPLDFFTAPITLERVTVDAIYREMLRRADVAFDMAVHCTDNVEDDILAHILEDSANAAAARRHLGLAKIGPCADWIEERLHAGEPKILVGALHTDVIKGLEERLLDHDPVVFHGATSHADRIENVRKFQEDPRCRVFIGHIKAAGTAITLTAAKCVFFAEFRGTPGDNYQFASRAHRMGQKDGVQAYFATVANSLDERLAKSAERRAREIAEIFD